jgi:hypothetical protein
MQRRTLMQALGGLVAGLLVPFETIAAAVKEAWMLETLKRKGSHRWRHLEVHEQRTIVQNLEGRTQVATIVAVGGVMARHPTAKKRLLHPSVPADPVLEALLLGRLEHRPELLSDREPHQV